MKVEFECPTHHGSHGSGKFQNHKRAVRPKDATHFFETFPGILEVSKSKGDGDGIKRSGRKRNSQGVGFHRPDCAIEPKASRLGQGANEHGMAEVCGDNGNAKTLMQFDRQVPGAAAKIETKFRLDSTNKLFDFSCGELAPSPVDRDRKEVIQEVVTGRDLSKHLTDHAAVGPMELHSSRCVTGELCFHR